MKNIEKLETMAQGKARFVRIKPEMTAQELVELAKQRGLVAATAPESLDSAPGT